MENTNIKISDINIVHGDWVRKPVDIFSPWSIKVLHKHKDIDMHFTNKESKFGLRDKAYLRVWIFCKNIEEGLIEKDNILEKYSHLEVLYIQHIEKRGQDWKSDIWRYGNAIEIIFIPQ